MTDTELRMLGEDSRQGLWIRRADSKFFMFWSPFDKTWKPSEAGFDWVMKNTKHKCFINSPIMKGRVNCG